MRRSYFQIAILAAILLWCGLFLSQKIDLSTADLGRHLMNGKILLEASWGEKLALLHTNFYSYSLPEQTFINHHWLSGVIFYLISLLGGFTLLSFFYVLFYLGAIALFWNVARKASSFMVASFVLILLVPLLTGRIEVRPEVWTYFLSGVFLNLLYFRAYRWSIPFLMLLWVNLHIGFIFGFLILGAWIGEELFKLYKGEESEWRTLALITLAACFLALLNPFGYHALLFPLLIFQDYGYRVVENQSVHFLENLGLTGGMDFLLFKSVALSSLAAFVILLVKKVRTPLSLALPILVTGVMAYLGIRHFPVFALFALVFLSFAVEKLVVGRVDKHLLTIVMGIALVFSLSSQLEDLSRLTPVLGWGTLLGVNGGAEFFEANQLSGPIFNNYDIGGYLIYHLFPEEKVFVDNRPEAYTPAFFEKEYIEPEENEAAWQALEARYHFNVIFFSHRDYTPWGQTFLLSRVEDPEWAPIFLDNYHIIFLKRTPANQAFITRYEISKDAFGISPNR